MKVKQITEVAYAGQRSIQHLLKFFTPNDGVEIIGWTAEEVEEEYGQFYKINEQFVGKWIDDHHSGDVTGMGVRDERWGASISVFETDGILAENIDEKEFLQKIQIFAKPKRLF